METSDRAKIPAVSGLAMITSILGWAWIYDSVA